MTRTSGILSVEKVLGLSLPKDLRLKCSQGSTTKSGEVGLPGSLLLCQCEEQGVSRGLCLFPAPDPLSRCFGWSVISFQQGEVSSKKRPTVEMEQQGAAELPPAEERTW